MLPIWLRQNFVNYSYIFEPDSFHYQLLHSCHKVALKQKNKKCAYHVFLVIFIRDKKGIQILSRNSVKDKPLSSGLKDKRNTFEQLSRIN